MTDFTQCTATELTDLYRSGSVSPVTVAEQVLAKIEQLNPVLNAFCFTDPATTLAQAKASEQRWQQGCPLSELDGVPVAFKDSILTQGWPTLHASQTVDSNQSWSEDAPSAMRLREAGAVFAGKTTMSEFGSTEYHSNSLLYGNVCNPWNLSHTTGGSSGGSASAVSAGLVPVALGTDFGGSIAVPSAFCGVFGMRPGTGRVPQWPVDLLELSAVGPMARSTNDLKLIMNIITKPDVCDNTSLPYNNINFHANNKISWSNKKIACIKSISGAIIESVEKTVDYLLGQGAQIDFINLDIESAINIFSELSVPNMWHQWLDIPEEKRRLAGREIQHRAIWANRPDDTYNQLVQRQKLIIQTRKVMQCYDVLLGSAIATDSNKQTESMKHVYLSPLSILFCLIKQPTITIPIGIGVDGMPMSVMIAGNMHDDINMLQMAQDIESAFPMPPSPLFY